MKPTKKLFVIITALILCFNLSFAQEEQQGPEYITVTTMHWNMDRENFSMSDWKAMEKAYMDNVTKKNEFIAGASFYMHRWTESNTELMYVQAYNSWADIENAQKRNGELEKEAWPNEEERNNYFKDRDSYYDTYHSDEIYATMPGAKLMAEEPTGDMVLYVRKSHFAFPEDGSQEEFMKYHMMWADNVVAKNDVIKAYYPNAHAWGSDKTEFVEAFFVDSLADLEKMNEKNGEIFESTWSEDELKDMGENFGKYFTGVHGDFIYTYIHGLGK
jgi:hypothetical protein